MKNVRAVLAAATLALGLMACTSKPVAAAKELKNESCACTTQACITSALRSYTVNKIAAGTASEEDKALIGPLVAEAEACAKKIK